MHRLMTWRGTTRCQCNDDGFVLPLAISTSVVLLLSSALLHTLALQGRLRARQQWQSSLQHDQLRSAAMMLMAQASDSVQRCVLASPSSDWSARASRCPDADLDPLRSGHVDDVSWQLLQWYPTPWGATLQIALDGDGAAAELRLHRHGDHFRLAEGLVVVSSPKALHGSSALEAS